MHATPAGRGRCEIRHGDLADGIAFLDVSMRAAGFGLPFAALRAMGIERAALHSSKYQGDELKDAARRAGMRLVSPYSVYYGADVAV